MQASPPKVVIVGLDHAVGLQTARIFARRNIPVIGVAREKRHYGCRTNVCEKKLFTDTHSEDLVDCLVSLGKSLDQKAVLVPCRDPSVSIISRHRNALEPYYHFLLPEPELVDALMDKAGFRDLAESQGFRIPRTFVLESPEDAEKAAAKLTYPCIVKPAVKTDAWTRATSQKAIKISSHEEFLETFDKFKKLSSALIVQEWIEGGDANLYSCNGFFDKNSKPVVTFVARKIRQWPPHVGETSMGEECRDDFVLNESVRFFKKIGFTGLGYLELKKDENSGEYHFIEANIGRPTGRSALAEACGVELLYSMYCDLAGLPLPSERQQQYRGVKWINLVTDLASALALWRRGELEITEWFKSLQGEKCFAIWSLRDPRPFIGQFPWGFERERKKERFLRFQK